MESEYAKTVRNSESDTVIEGEDEFGLKEVHAYLADKLERLSVVIDKYHAVEDNNPAPLMAEDTADKHHVLKYKLRFISCLVNQLKNSTPQEYTQYPSHVQMDVTADLKKEVQTLRTLLLLCQKELDADKKELASLENKIKNIQEMSEMRQEKAEIHEVHSLMKVQRVLGVEFNKHKREMYDMMQELFQGDSAGLRDLLADLCTAYFDDESDPYISLENVSYSTLEMLLQADIVTRHPHDPNKIMLTNLLH